MNICVFSSSSNAVDQKYFAEAKLLGQIIGNNGHNLVNGGANVGLMEEVALAALQSGAKTIGIIPKRFIGKSLASKSAEEIIITKDMHERKSKMIELSDAFVALPGGFGTLDEILEVITLRQLAYHTKPIVFINTNDFFKYLKKQFEVSISEFFIKKEYKDLYYFANNAVEAIAYIENYLPEEIDSKWFIVPEKEN